MCNQILMYIFFIMRFWIFVILLEDMHIAYFFSQKLELGCWEFREGMQHAIKS